jgi:hypothetical protein
MASFLALRFASWSFLKSSAVFVAMVSLTWKRLADSLAAMTALRSAAQV